MSACSMCSAVMVPCPQKISLALLEECNPDASDIAAAHHVADIDLRVRADLSVGVIAAVEPSAAKVLREGLCVLDLARRDCAPTTPQLSALRKLGRFLGPETSFRTVFARREKRWGLPAPRVAPQPRPAAIKQACAMSAQMRPAVMNPQRRG
eukprot:COSAG04_NODE_517_length_13186_cov_7.434248_11_plen_152_part_00